jgi:hypothetical protein
LTKYFYNNGRIQIYKKCFVFFMSVLYFELCVNVIVLRTKNKNFNKHDLCLLSHYISFGPLKTIELQITRQR